MRKSLKNLKHFASTTQHRFLSENPGSVSVQFKSFCSSSKCNQSYSVINVVDTFHDFRFDWDRLGVNIYLQFENED